MKDGRPQAKGIDDRAVLAAVYNRSAGIGASRWDVESALVALGVEMPEKVLLAKLGSLTHRKLLDGCACGCRGDFGVTPLGMVLLGRAEHD